MLGHSTPRASGLSSSGEDVGQEQFRLGPAPVTGSRDEKPVNGASTRWTSPRPDLMALKHGRLAPGSHVRPLGTPSLGLTPHALVTCWSAAAPGPLTMHSPGSRKEVEEGVCIASRWVRSPGADVQKPKDAALPLLGWRQHAASSGCKGAEGRHLLPTCQHPSADAEAATQGQHQLTGSAAWDSYHRFQAELQKT